MSGLITTLLLQNLMPRLVFRIVIFLLYVVFIILSSIGRLRNGMNIVFCSQCLYPQAATTIAFFISGVQNTVS